MHPSIHPSILEPNCFHPPLLSILAGVGGWLLANALTEFAEAGRFGVFAGEWKVRRNLALAHAYKMFREHCSAKGIEHRVKRFNVTMLSMTSNQCWPDFKGKAHDTLVAVNWLAAWVLEHPCEDPRQKLIDTALLAHMRYHGIMREATETFTERQAQRFHHNGLVMLRAYALLAKDAYNRQRPRFQLKPKHHHLWHGFYHARLTLLNPRSHWLFKHEDYVGICTKVSRLIHPSSLSRRVLESFSIGIATRVSETRNTAQLNQEKKRAAHGLRNRRIKRMCIR
jgi:hypothetical protein